MTTKERIARTAIELIATKGVDAVSMRDIAGTVGVSEAAIYRHYKNKNDLVWEVFTSHYDVFAGELYKLQETQLALKDKLRVMVQGCCNVFDNDRELFTFLLLAQHIQRSAPLDYQAQLPVLLERLLVTAIKEGQIPEQDVHLTTAMVMGSVLQSALFCIYYKPQPKYMSPLSDTIAAACWRIVKGN